MKTAKIHYNGTVYQASGEGVLLASPVRTLIEFVYANHTSEARYILRQPIIINYEPSVFEQTLIKVGAKRFRIELDIVSVDGTQSKDQNERGSESLVVQCVDVEKSSEAKKITSRDLDLKDHSLNFTSQSEAISWFQKQSEETGVLAAYVNQKHSVLGVALNTNSIVKTRHAEMNLIAKLAATKRQKGDYVLVSLQSCRMCAAALAEWLGPENITVYYLKPEPALKNVKTALYGREILI